MASRKAAEPPTNRLLALLPPKDFQRLRPHLHRMPLEYRRSLYRAHRLIGFVYFIETGVGSLVNTMANGQASEVGTIGNEGVVGLPLVLGGGRAAAGGPHSLPTRKCHDHRRRGLVRAYKSAKEFFTDASTDGTGCRPFEGQRKCQ